MTMISEWLNEEAPDDNELAEVSFIVRSLRGRTQAPLPPPDKEDVPPEVLERVAELD